MTRHPRRVAAACAVALFGLNVYIVGELFTVEFTRFMGSIEGAHVAVARQLAESWDQSWWPLWYGGIPFPNTYPPFFHWITALFVVISGFSPALSDHAVSAFFYCAGPVTLFWLAHRLSARVWPSLAGALLYSLFSPSTVLMAPVRHDAGGVFHPRRLQAMVQYGEGPHVASMTLLALAIVLLDIAIARRRPWSYVLAAFGMACVALTNWLGAVALAAAVVAYILSHDRKDLRRVSFRCVGIALLAYAFAARWIPPSTITTVRTNAQRVSGPLQPTHLRYVAVLSIILVLVWALIEKTKAPAHARFFVVFGLFMSAVPLLSSWEQVHLLPEPERYHLEMEMALAPLAVFTLAGPIERLPRIPRMVALLSIAVFCCVFIKPYRHYARDLAKPIDVHDTSEYRVADWIDRNMNGRRVFVSGSEYFWLNAFTSTPQLAGDFDQGMTNPLLPAVLYQLYTGAGTGKEGELGVLWLKAFGVSAVAVSGPRSTEVYKPYHNWRKFDGLLPVAWHDGGDIIYRVLPDSVSLAHVLRPGDRMTRAPASVLDFEFVRAYVGALENPARAAGMHWTNRHHAVITAELRGGELLLVQVTYHPAWRARVNRAECRVTRDPIGLMMIDPQCAGRCVVDLDYGYDGERLMATLITWLTLIGALAWIVVPIIGMRYWSNEPVTRH